jgi:hypothetical protein
MQEAKKTRERWSRRKPYRRPKVVATYTKKKLGQAVRPHGSFLGVFSP